MLHAVILFLNLSLLYKSSATVCHICNSPTFQEIKTKTEFFFDSCSFVLKSWTEVRKIIRNDIQVCIQCFMQCAPIWWNFSAVPAFCPYFLSSDSVSIPNSAFCFYCFLHLLMANKDSMLTKYSGENHFPYIISLQNVFGSLWQVLL